jgi:Divergent InlB B-repeat domain
MNRLLITLAASALALSLAGCHSGSDSPRNFAISGSITGLTASGLVLTDNGTDPVTVPANSASFQFSSAIQSGGSYEVAVATQPTDLTCTVTQGSGSDVHQAITDVSVSCAPTTYVISGTITGLSASGLVLTNNGGDSLTVLTGSNSFQFSTPVDSGGQYNVAILSQPSGLTCTVSRGSGTNVTATVNNIAIACGATTYTIAGSVSGLTASGLTIEDNGGDSLAVSENATTFQFVTPVSAGAAYDVTVAAQPPGLTCTAASAAGSNVHANVTTVRITCDTSSFAIGGTVSGLTAAGLVLQDNAGDNLAVASGSGSFSFDTQVAYGSSYDVTVFAQPTGEICTVADGTGSATQTVNDVSVTCIANPTYTVVPSAGADGSISPSTAQLVNSGGNITFTATPNTGYAVAQWSVDGSAVQSGGSVHTLTDVTADHTLAVSFAQAVLGLSVNSLALAASGNAREITVQNAGSLSATNLVVSPGTFPSGTTLSTTCGTTLAPADTCSITITPGATATSACSSGIAPTPTLVSVSADDASPAQAQVSVLSYACLYQGGYLYSIDDTTSTSESIGGAVVDQADDSAAATWFDGSFVVTNAQSLTDGLTNTETIVAAQGSGTYAAEICVESGAGGYADWYLPASSEWIEIASEVASQGINNFNAGDYWTSSEYVADPPTDAWAMVDASSTAATVVAVKALDLGVRCARQITP